MDLFESGRAEAQAAYEAYRSGIPRGPRIALSAQLEGILGGCLPVGLTVVAGPPGSGKSAFVAQIAAEAGCPAVIVSCELRCLEILHRLAARASGIPLGKFHRGEIAPDEWERCVRQAIDRSPNLWIVDGTSGPVTTSYIRETGESARVGASHLVIVVDSVHSLVRGVLDGRMSEYELTSKTLQDLQQLGAELGAAILVVAEQNRETLKSSKDDGLHSAAGTRLFEYGAEAMLTLSRERDAQPDGEHEIVVTLRVVKNRRGLAGTPVSLKFCGERMSFREADEFSPSLARRKSA